MFLPFLDQSCPHLSSAYRRHFERQSRIHGAYEQLLADTVHALRDKYELHRAPPLPWGQMKLPLD